MQTDMSLAGVGNWVRRAWLLPLILSLFGCGGSADETPASVQATAGETQASTQATADGAPASTPATSIPEGLRGQWETILTYVPPFYSGPYAATPPGGDGSIGITFYFWPDGRYQHFWNLATSYFGGNCFRTAGWDEFGTVSGTGSEFTFSPGRASYLSTDSCGQSKILDPAPVTAASHTLTLDRDNSGWPILRMSFPNGELVLEKCKRCQ